MYRSVVAAGAAKDREDEERVGRAAAKKVEAKVGREPWFNQ